MNLNVEIGIRIRFLRNANKLTQLELARLLGLKTQGAVGKIESGEISLDPEKIIRLADAFGTTTDFILRGNYETNAVMFADRNLKKVQRTIFEASRMLERMSNKMLSTKIRGGDEA